MKTIPCGTNQVEESDAPVSERVADCMRTMVAALGVSKQPDVVLESKRWAQHWPEILEIMRPDGPESPPNIIRVNFRGTFEGEIEKAA